MTEEEPTSRPLTPLVAAAIAFVVSALLAGVLVLHLEQQRIGVKRAETAQLATGYAAALQREIEHTLAITSTFAALIRQGGDRIPDFEDTARELLPYYPGASAVHLAPDGVVREVFPLAENAAVVGLDLLAYPARAKESVLARDSGRLTLAGPYALVQGGLGAVGRLPVFLGDADGRRFWGFVSVVMRLPETIETAGLAQLAQQGFHYKLTRLHPDTGLIQVIAESSEQPLHRPVEHDLVLPNGNWTLGLSPAKGWDDPIVLAFQIGLGLVVSLLLATLTKLLMESRRLQTALARKVDFTTAELRAREADLQRAEEIAQVGSWDFDIQLNRSTNSAVASRITGVPPDTPVSLEHFLEKVHPLDRAAVASAWQTALRGEPYDVEHRTLIDGSLRWLRHRAVLEFDSEGRALRAAGTVEDITERKLAQEALQQSEERLREIIGTAREGIWTIDLDGVTTFANPRMAELLGYRIEELVGRSFFDFMDPDSRGAAERDLAKRRAGIAETHEFRFRRLDGSHLWTLVNTNPLYGDDGEVTGALAMITDISARKEDEAAIRRLAFYDPLTGLANRRLLLDRLNQTLATSARTGQDSALIFIDLDNFKQLNDTRGHRIGDLLLEEVARRLTETVRKSDSVARLGGDEFVVLLQTLGEDPAQAATVAEGVGEKIIAALGMPYLLAGSEHNSTASLGIALFDCVPGTAEEILKHADLAMYQAKAAGRNRLRFYDPMMQASVNQRAALERELRHAIGDGQLVLHYQSQVDTQGRINGAEALLRWRHPERGLIPPAQFIGRAESLGLDLALGRWVLASACAQLAEWGRRPESAGLTLAVNISGSHFRRPELVEDVRRALAESGADPRRLRLELIESPLLDDPEDALVKMLALKETGVGFTLDNFGSGYCSLSYLKRLPLDQLKLAPAFVREVLEDSDDDATADSFVALAESLGLGIMAEGVETEAQRDYLLHHGCQTFQGFLFGLPGPVDALFQAAAQPRARSEGAAGDAS